jgi:hypothetical protein
MQQMARRPFMDFTMGHGHPAVKGRKSAAFARHMLAVPPMVNHY